MTLHAIRPSDVEILDVSWKQPKAMRWSSSSPVSSERSVMRHADCCVIVFSTGRCNSHDCTDHCSALQLLFISKSFSCVSGCFRQSSDSHHLLPKSWWLYCRGIHLLPTSCPTTEHVPGCHTHAGLRCFVTDHFLSVQATSLCDIAQASQQPANTRFHCPTPMANHTQHLCTAVQ